MPEKNLDKLHPDDFKPHEGSPFTVKLKDDTGEVTEYVLTLREVQVLAEKGSEQATDKRDAFSLLLTNERTDAYLQQGVYSLYHDELGILQLFIVPLGPKDGKMQYQIIFT